MIRAAATLRLIETATRNATKHGLDIETLTESNAITEIQKWINHNDECGVTASTIRTYFSLIHTQLYLRGVKLDPMDIRHRLQFPRKLRPEQVAITRKEIDTLLAASNSQTRFQILGLISSGMRVSELFNITQDNIVMESSNYMVRIPAEITKSGSFRITFFSKQVSDMIRDRINRGRPLFANGDATHSLDAFEGKFNRVRQACGLLARFTHTKGPRYHIHIHSFRGYFVTRCNRVQFGLGHTLAGHGYYMKEYNQYTRDELRSMYRKAEPDMTFKLGAKKK